MRMKRSSCDNAVDDCHLRRLPLRRFWGWYCCRWIQGRAGGKRRCLTGTSGRRVMTGRRMRRGRRVQGSLGLGHRHRCLWGRSCEAFTPLRSIRGFNFSGCDSLYASKPHRTRLTPHTRSVAFVLVLSCAVSVSWRE